ncbi:hypothetical protein U1Q18_023294 [Sarracenia purpurea var. burkii]
MPIERVVSGIVSESTIEADAGKRTTHMFLVRTGRTYVQGILSGREHTDGIEHTFFPVCSRMSGVWAGAAECKSICTEMHREHNLRTTSEPTSR